MRLYRIIDFFEFVQLLDDEILRVPSAARFSDPNELLGHLLLRFMDPALSPYTKDEIGELVETHRLLRASYFVSCWTKTRDSIALWEIYSPVHSAVQIEIEHSDLEYALEAYCKARSFEKGLELPPDANEILFYPPDSGDCEYLNLSKLYRELKEEFEGFRNSFDEAVQHSDKEKRRLAWEGGRGNLLRRFDALRFCKNEAYAHEREYRVQLKAAKRNHRKIEDCTKDRFSLLFDTHLRPVGPPEIGENIFVPIAKSIIKNVYLDGRAAEWLVGCQKKLLKERGISARRSNAYGAFVDQNELTPWW